MGYLRRLHFLQYVLNITALLVIISVSVLTVNYQKDIERQDAQIKWQLASLSAIYQATEPLQGTELMRLVSEALSHDNATVDVWRVNSTEKRLYDWQRISGTGNTQPEIHWPTDQRDNGFFDGQDQEQRWRAVQRIASNQAGGDILIRVYRPLDSLSTYFINRLDSVLLVVIVCLALAVGTFVLASTSSLAQLDELAAELEQTCEDSSVTRLPTDSHFPGFEKLASTLNKSLMETRKQNRRMAAFASETAHELKTPLTTMRMLGEIGLREREQSGHFRDCVGAMLEECQHMEQLIEGILLIAQAKSRRVDMAIAPVDLTELAAEYVEKLEPLADANGMSLELSLDPTELRQTGLNVACDRVLLRQAGINLISNAILHNPPGTRIAIKTLRTDSAACLIITDDGTGFEPRSEEETFKRNQMDRCTNSGTRHLGLGLSIATSLIESQGGRLTIDSTIGLGTIVVIEIPLEPPEMKPSSDDIDASEGMPTGKIVANVA